MTKDITEEDDKMPPKEKASSPIDELLDLW